MTDNRGADVEILCVRCNSKSKDQIGEGQVGKKEAKKGTNLKDLRTACNNSH